MESTEASKRDIMGVVLILVGILLLMRNLGAGLGIGELWPWFIILFGLAFWAMFLSDRSQHALLMPASILIVTGIIFEICTLAGWGLMSRLWPALVMAPGIGFVTMSFYGPAGTSLLAPGVGLLVLGAAALLKQSSWWRFWPILLIVGGVFLLFREFRRRVS